MKKIAFLSPGYMVTESMAQAVKDIVMGWGIPQSEIEMQADIAFYPSTQNNWQPVLAHSTAHYTRQCFEHTETELFKRARQLYLYLIDPQIHFIWCMRGGYGTAELLHIFLEQGFYAKLKEKVAKKEKIAEPGITHKIIMGYSDCTHLACLSAVGYHFIHGPVAVDLLSDRQETIAQVKKMIRCYRAGQPFYYEIPMQPVNKAAEQLNHQSCRIVGGNLSKVVQAAGYNRYPLKKFPYRRPLTPALQQLLEVKLGPDRLLLLEDVDETPEDVLRMLNFLDKKNYFQQDRLLGVLLGDFCWSGVVKDQGQKSVMKMLKQWGVKQGIPVLVSKLIGHGGQNAVLSMSCAPY